MVQDLIKVNCSEEYLAYGKGYMHWWLFYYYHTSLSFQFIYVLWFGCTRYVFCKFTFLLGASYLNLSFKFLYFHIGWLCRQKPHMEIIWFKLGNSSSNCDSCFVFFFFAWGGGEGGFLKMVLKFCMSFFGLPQQNSMDWVGGRGLNNRDLFSPISGG